MMKIVKDKKKLSVPVQEGSIEDNSVSVVKMQKFLANTHIGRNSIGLASNQLGLKGRVIFVKIHGEIKELNYGWCHFINPVIVSHSERMMPSIEGCLSIPDTFIEIQRPKICKVEYVDINGKIRTQEFDGLLSTCVQHEINHLDGKLIIDNLSKLKRDFIIRKISKNKKNPDRIIV